ncbi:hypothetical protein SAMD00023353_0500740 [Rosellinia necatrix]|uniref:Alcohol acetyltransferase n=1 Tax=Rosellinia necatrix TaxID=77044 RepID=A0A1S7UK90_ROSNE|nr:hypothetical protein SAMD00023353_0500740 [Rosellinia necatrix]
MGRPGPRHWLDRYGTGYHAWAEEGGGFSRPCGLVELRFDADGRYLGGRADISALLTLGVSTRLPDAELRRHILLAFALLRLRHCLLGARAEPRTLEVEPWFFVPVPATADAATRDAGRALRFLDAAADGVSDGADFYVHALNVARVVEPSEALGRLFVLPMTGEGEEKEGGGRRRTLRCLFVMAHEILDGLTCMSWMTDFTRIVNMPTARIREAIEAAVLPESIRAALPPAQEDLYAPVAPTRALARWFWAITIILRHVKQPPPAAFPNPLRRATPLPASRPFAAKYPSVLDYSQTPPLNSFFVKFQLSPAASRRLYRLCGEAGASVGAGGFALVGMAMMALHEARHPDEAEDARRPFVGSFPLNPRPFFGARGLDSVMLAFCKGVVLPFLPSRLGLEGRFRLLARQASRQLAVYQKGGRERPRRAGADELAHAGLNGAGRLVASNYIDGVERLRQILPPHLAGAVPPPQGAYEAPPWAVSRATCGVSSVGRVDWSAARFDLDADPGDGVIASVESLHSGVRVRDTEFLVATWSEDGVITAGVSFDGNYVDEGNAHQWVEKMKSLLEPTDDELDMKARL